ncbi:hypothetical protein, partial [Catenibacillus scindens]|uniref:hypothetical protein n=1 Tax=Catenibacillus scindens TaxID=673271 RepID=UPI003207A670
HPNGCMESMRAAGLDKNSLIFFVYDGTSRTLDITPAIASCKKYGCHISIMTCQEHFPHDDLCDDIIVTGKASSAVSSIMIHDLVFQYLSTLYREKFM